MRFLVVTTVLVISLGPAAAQLGGALGGAGASAGDAVGSTGGAVGGAAGAVGGTAGSAAGAAGQTVGGAASAVGEAVGRTSDGVGGVAAGAGAGVSTGGTAAGASIGAGPSAGSAGATGSLGVGASGGVANSPPTPGGVTTGAGATGSTDPLGSAGPFGTGLGSRSSTNDSPPGAANPGGSPGLQSSVVPRALPRGEVATIPATAPFAVLIPPRLEPDGPRMDGPRTLATPRGTNPWAGRRANTALVSRDVLNACRTALVRAAKAKGASAVEVAGAGASLSSPDGGLSAPLFVRVRYARGGRS
jgi:hypothetical protein